MNRLTLSIALLACGCALPLRARPTASPPGLALTWRQERPEAAAPWYLIAGPGVSNVVFDFRSGAVDWRGPGGSYHFHLALEFTSLSSGDLSESSRHDFHLTELVGAADEGLGAQARSWYLAEGSAVSPSGKLEPGEPWGSYPNMLGLERDAPPELYVFRHLPLGALPHVVLTCQAGSDLLVRGDGSVGLLDRADPVGWERLAGAPCPLGSLSLREGFLDHASEDDAQRWLTWANDREAVLASFGGGDPPPDLTAPR